MSDMLNHYLPRPCGRILEIGSGTGFLTRRLMETLHQMCIRDRPCGIAPLEAMQCGTPSIISKQSGCGEILDKVIKTDYWDINAMAEAISVPYTHLDVYKRQVAGGGSLCLLLKYD